MMRLGQRAKNIGTASSQLFHVLVTAGSADPKVTTSARLGKQVMRGEGWAITLCRAISFVLRDTNHCAKAYNADKRRAQKAHF